MTTKLTSLFNLSIWMLAGQVSAGSIAGWWNTRGPSFIMQDDETGEIRYSLCNTNHTPIFPDDRTLTIPFTSNPPKNKTSLSAAGWMEGSTTAVASIFYLNEHDDIINAVLQCDWNTGKWQSTGEYVTSGGSPRVSPTTGISAVLLGSSDGYRVLYNDLTGTLQQIGYTSATTWGYYGVVSQDKASSQAIATTFYNLNVSVVRPRDDENLGISQLNSNHSWHISSVPEGLTRTGATNATDATDLTLSSSTPNFTLPSWNGNASALAMSTDRDGTRSIFYIGTDRNLHQISNINGSSTWTLPDAPSDSNAWLEADTAGGEIGIASDFGSSILRLYYFSDGRMIEVNGDNGRWQSATVLAPSNSSQISANSSDSNTAGNSTSTDDGSEDLSSGAKAGISVGVVLGVLAIGGMAFAFWFLRMRQKKLDNAAAAESVSGGGAPSEQKSPSSAYTAPDSVTGMMGPPGSHDGYNALSQPAVMGYPPTQGGYTQGAYPAGYAYPAQAGFSQDGSWPQQQQQYYYQQPQQQQQQQQAPQELPVPIPPAEMMGEGHYKEIP